MQGVPSILIARLQDGLVYGFFLLVALVWTGNVGLVWRWFVGGIQLGTVLLVPAVGFAAVLLYRRFGTRLPVARNVMRLLPEIASSFRAISASVWAGTFLLTFSARFTSFIAVVFLYQSLGLSLPLATVFLITSLYVFLPYILVNTPAGIGITEGFLVAMFVYGGIDRGVAAAASIQVHLLQLIVAAILAAVGFIALQYLRRRDRSRGLVLS